MFCSPTLQTTTCGSLLRESQKIQVETGESDTEIDKMPLQFEHECLYVNKSCKYKADLHQSLAEADSEVVSAGQATVSKGVPKDQISAIKPVLEDLRGKKDERVKEFWEVQSQIVQLLSILKGVQVDVDSSTAQEILTNIIDHGNVDVSDLLAGIDDQIIKAKEQALSRKDILEKMEKWKFAVEEEAWFEDYERDQNRYSAGKGAQKKLKRAEKARTLASKIPSLLENLKAKVKVWEEKKGIQFMYDKVPLLETLQLYIISRQEREEEKLKTREKKRLQEQHVAEQEILYGSRPSPLGALASQKPLGQINSDTAGGTSTGRHTTTTPLSRHGISAAKERGDKATSALMPDKYVALPKDDPPISLSSSAAVSPSQTADPESDPESDSEATKYVYLTNLPDDTSDVMLQLPLAELDGFIQVRKMVCGNFLVEFDNKKHAKKAVEQSGLRGCWVTAQHQISATYATVRD